MKILKDISEDNFIFGGLAYHHKEIIDPEERNKQFQKLVDKHHGNDSKYIEDVTVGVDNIYSLMATLKNIQSSQSLSELAMNKTMEYFGNETEEHPIDEIYEDKEHQNIWIAKGIKIIDSDIIIFLPMNGMLGSIYSKDSDKQRMGIMYDYNDEMSCNVGQVFDVKIYEDFLNYKKFIGDIK